MAAVCRLLRCCAVLLTLVAFNSHAMMRYVVSAFRTPAERALWMYAIQRPDIAELAKVLGSSNVNPNFMATVWDGKWPECHEAMTPLAMAAVCGNMPVVHALMASSKVDIDCGGYTAVQHGGVEVTCLDRAARLVQEMQRRIDAIRAAGVDPSIDGGHLGESLQRELNIQRRIAQLLDEAGGKSALLDDDELKRLLYEIEGVE